MKKLFIVLIVMLCLKSGSGQNCLPGNTYTNSPSWINNFQTNYPGCTRIDGNLTINGLDSNFTNLNGLSVLTSIGGDLEIRHMPSTILTGLNNLTTIDGKLIIYNTSITDFSGLNKLTSVGELDIHDNPNLINYTGLDSLTNITWSLKIDANSSLQNLSGLNNLHSIGGYIWIKNNPSLTSLIGLQGLTTTNGVIWIEHNLLLTTLTGLDNLSQGAIIDLLVYTNPALCDCDIHSICVYLANPGGIIEIHDNALGCNTSAEILAACQTAIPEIPIENKIIITSNPSNNKITISSPLTIENGQFLIYNIRGNKIIESQFTGKETQIDISPYAKGLYFIKLSTAEGSVVRKFVKE
jgi:hypothetical protein